MKPLKAHQQERVPAPPPIEGIRSARTVLADKGPLCRAKRRALVGSAPFRPIPTYDGRLRQEHLHGLATHYQIAGLDAHNWSVPCFEPAYVPFKSPPATVKASSFVPIASKDRRNSPLAKLPDVDRTRESPFTNDPETVVPLPSK